MCNYKSGYKSPSVGYDCEPHFRVYLDPKEPTFLGLLVMASLYDSLKR